jgi:hypothetical protein
VTTPAPVIRGPVLGCLILFMLPFVTVGVVHLGQAVFQAARGDWGGAAFLALFGLVFGLVGVGGIAGAMKVRRAAVAADAQRAARPETPWLWRADWAKGRIEDSSRSTMTAAWLLAGFWNLITLPSAFFAVRQALRDESYGLLWVLIFPAVGLGLLAWATHATLRFRRFGLSRLELSTIPAPIGRSLRGTVVATGALDARDRLRVTLTCVRRVTTGSGKSRSTRERVLWQEEQQVEGRQARSAEGMITSIPVDFRVPSDAEPSDASNPRNQVVWRLAVTAEVPGVDYASTFEVPVFRTGESEELTSAPLMTPPSPPEPYVQPASSRVQVTRNRRGTEVVFPAARNPGAAGGLTAFLAIWLAAVWATVHFDAPLVFQILFGIFGLFLLWATIALWFGVTRVTVGDGAVVVSSGLLAPFRERRLPAADVAEVVARIGMQAGNTPYYDVILVRKDGKQIPAGRGIRDKREAEWLAGTVRDALRG